MDELALDPGDLTVEDLEFLESHLGVALEQLDGDEVPKLKLLRALIYVLARHQQPDFTLEDAGKAKIADLGPLKDAFAPFVQAAAGLGSPVAGRNGSSGSSSSRRPPASRSAT